MLDSELFSALDGIGRRTRRNETEPFGGVQLVCVGLSPNQPGCLLLKQSIRQSGDSKFATLLDGLRHGNLSTQAKDALDACHVRCKPPPSDNIVPTKLYCTNRNV